MRNRSNRRWVLFSVAASVLPFAGATAQTYSVVDIASLNGAATDQAAAINAHGSITGTQINDAIVSNGVTVTYLMPLRLYDNRTVGSGINTNGEVTGYSYGIAGGSQYPHAFLYTSGGMMTNLGTLPGGDSSYGAAINASGQIAGYATVAGDVIEHAFLYSNGTMTDLGTLPGGTMSYGNAINDSGIVAGQAKTANGDLHAFVTQGNSLIDPGTIAGGTTTPGYTSGASAINNAGQIAGTSSVLPSGMHAFLYSGGKMTDLGTLGGANSFANDLNSSGEIVGVSDTKTGGGAFLYANGVMTDLNSLVDPSDPLFGKAALFGAVGINDSGWIVVNGANLTSQVAPVFGAFLLVPLRFSPRSLTFSDQPVGTQSGSQPITLTNLAITPLAITAIVPSSGFTQSNDCPAALTTGSSCTIQVGFAPSAYGSLTGVLNITTATTTLTLPAALKGGGYIAVSMTSSAANVTAGMPVTLKWTSNSTATCTATGGTTGDGWGGTVPANGTKSVVEKTAGTYTYTLSCPVNGVLPQASATVKDSAPASGGGGGGGGGSGGSGGGGGGAMDLLTLGTVFSALLAVRRRAAQGRAAGIVRYLCDRNEPLILLVEREGLEPSTPAL